MNFQKLQKLSFQSHEQYQEQQQCQPNNSNDLSKEEILLINQNQNSLLQAIEQKTINITLRIEQLKKINYLYSQQRKQKLSLGIQTKQQEFSKMKEKNLSLMKKKQDLLKQVNAKRKLLNDWKKQFSDKQVQHCQNVQKFIMIQEIQKDTKRALQENAKIQEKIKDLNPKIRFLKQKREQLQKQENGLKLQIGKKFIQLQYLKQKAVSSKENKENQSYQANIQQNYQQKSNFKGRNSNQKQRNSTKSKLQQRKSTQPNSQSKILRQSKKGYLVPPFDFNLA